MSQSFQRKYHCISHLSKFDIEDLQYVENDLCFYELVSLGLLLYGNDHVNAQFILQKLLVLSHSQNNMNGDLLRQYARNNPEWKSTLIEALAIIKAKRVLRKLGFQYEELREFYLLHIPELSVKINPLLKALYTICESMKPSDAGTMVQSINEQFKKPDEHLRFYDFAYLEIFLLDWLSRKIIEIHDNDASKANLQVLINYFKLNDMDKMKDLLVQTIKTNSIPIIPNDQCNTDTQDSSSEPAVESNNGPTESPKKPETTVINARETTPFISNECYQMRKEHAGYILIINQIDFYEEPDPESQHLLPPKKLRERKGTDVDKEKLKKVFSSFGFMPLVFENLTHIEILSTIRETVKRSLFHDSLIVCILSHGIDGAVYGSNSIPVEIAVIEQIITDDILQGKPKMLIIQACQKDEASAEARKKKIPPPKCRPDGYVDIIKAMSTVPGYASMRHTMQGTWFIQSLCDKIDELGDIMHALDILIAVTKAVTDKRGDRDEIMVPMTVNTLRNYFFLPKRK